MILESARKILRHGFNIAYWDAERRFILSLVCKQNESLYCRQERQQCQFEYTYEHEIKLKKRKKNGGHNGTLAMETVAQKWNCIIKNQVDLSIGRHTALDWIYREMIFFFILCSLHVKTIKPFSTLAIWYIEHRASKMNGFSCVAGLLLNGFIIIIIIIILDNRMNMGFGYGYGVWSEHIYRVVF